ncbi:DUF6644 family protein [Phenylobacterium sp.]|jgi:hypothetical protein|uniref:DUF6644 family protein n=1 Tax=Phenylobacterium sp. TaxID=1871053 RepID=UPI00120DFFBA|nr:DUF6644 family protein [Phenylobacterium sp.]THD51559.1 MAG: hypothetical protein E8A12_20805 [Phenylobacterium sp.]
MSSMNLEHFFPQAKAWVDTLGDIPPGSWVKGPKFGYASWEVGHILSLIVIGGTTILMNLRLLGAGVTEEKPSEIYRNLRVLQNIGVIGIIITGVLIGAANATKLYDSSAFTVKMMALLSGIILTYGVSRPVAAANGAVALMPKIWFAIGGSIFLIDLWMFATTDLIDVGIYHVITAAALILIPVTRGRLRWGYIAGMVVLIVAQFVHTHFVIKPDDYDHLNPVNKIYTALYAVWIVGTALITLFRGRGEEGGPLTKLVAYSTMLVWVLGAAAGRWIAFQ